MTDAPTLSILAGTAATIAFVHTLIGVDHSVPFIAMGRARGWSLGRVLAVTAVCGLAHVLSSVVLGGIGIAFGVALGHLEFIESARGNLASWLLIAFGLTYAAISWRRPHSHGTDRGATWPLFIVFVLGPCEPLIPLLMFPAATAHWSWVLPIVLLFAVVTVGTMLVTVSFAHLGLSRSRGGLLERHLGTVAGLAIAASGCAVQVVGP